MANCVIKLAHQLQLLINLMREHQLSGGIIQMGETTHMIQSRVKIIFMFDWGPGFFAHHSQNYPELELPHGIPILAG